MSSRSKRETNRSTPQRTGTRKAISAARSTSTLSRSNDALGQAEYVVRHCHGIKEFEACLRLEREVWKSADIDIVPIPLFVVASETGGHVLGAFHRNEMFGFTMTIAGSRTRKPFLHSHMTAVIHTYQSRGTRPPLHA